MIIRYLEPWGLGLRGLELSDFDAKLAISGTFPPRPPVGSKK